MCGKEGDRGTIAGCLQEDAFVRNDNTVFNIPWDRDEVSGGACPPDSVTAVPVCHTEHSKVQ